MVVCVASGSVFTDFRVLEDSVTMVRLNLFRPLLKTRPFSEDFVEEEPYCDPQWPHLRVVYAFFLDLVRQSSLSALCHIRLCRSK